LGAPAAKDHESDRDELRDELLRERARRVQLEEELHQVRDKLESRLEQSHADLDLAQEQVHLLAAIVESSEDAVIGCTLGGIIIIWNHGAERLFGYSAQEILGECTARFSFPDELKALQKVQEGEDVPPFEAVRRRKDGKEIHVSVRISPIRDGEGKLVGASAICRDVSERRRLEEQMRQAQKMEAVGQLAGGVAHDFNNLLTVVAGYSEVLLGSLPADNPTVPLLKEIHKAGERAVSLTRQLLMFSRRQMQAPEVLDINAIITEMEKMLRRMIGEDILLRTDLSPGLGQVKADRGQIEQILMNLAVNSRDAMPEGGKLIIETTNAVLGEDVARSQLELKPGRYSMLAVSDNGCGMDEQVKARIFEPFFTTKGPGKGTGLGLATVYGIVQQCQGAIYVYSEPGRGTTFKIYFPQTEEGCPLSSSKSFSCVRNAPRGGETILLVEDEDAVRGFTRHALTMYGYTVLEASGAREALQLFRQHQGPLHLLLTDVVMPEIGGRQLAERLLELKPRLKVLYVSGYTDNAVLHHDVLEADAAFLQKPFTPAALANKVRELLDR
jgi:PAS domain S-box-containing protein